MASAGSKTGKPFYTEDTLSAERRAEPVERREGRSRPSRISHPEGVPQLINENEAAGITASLHNSR